jgi:hypothetical protein
MDGGSKSSPMPRAGVLTPEPGIASRVLSLSRIHCSNDVRRKSRAVGRDSAPRDRGAIRSRRASPTKREVAGV